MAETRAWIASYVTNGTGGAVSHAVASEGVETVMQWIEDDGFDLERDIIAVLGSLRLKEPLRTLRAPFVRRELEKHRDERLSPQPAPPARAYPRAPPGLLGSVSGAALQKRAFLEAIYRES